MTKFLKDIFHFMRGSLVLATILVAFLSPMSWAGIKKVSEENTPFQGKLDRLVSPQQLGLPDSVLNRFEKNNLEAVRQNVPERAYRHFHKAYLLMRSEKASHKAIAESLTRALEVEPRFPEALAFRANARMANQEWKSAEADLKSAIALAPEWAPPYFLRAIIYAENGDPKKGLPDAERALLYSPDDAQMHAFHGAVLFALAEYEKAEKALATAIAIEPKDHLLYCQRAEIYREMAQFEKADADVAKSEELLPGNAAAGTERVKTLWRREKYDAALDGLSKLISGDPKDPEFCGMRGLILMDKREYQKAFAQFDHCLASNPRWPEPHYYKALTYFNMGFRNRTREELDKFLKKNPTHVRALALRSAVGNETFLINALELEPNDPDLRFELAKHFFSAGEPQKALLEAERILGYSPKYWQGHLIRCQHYSDEDKKKEALDACREARRVNPYLIDLDDLLAGLDEEVNRPVVFKGPRTALSSERGIGLKKLTPKELFDEIASHIKTRYVDSGLNRIQLDESRSPDVGSLISQLAGRNNWIRMQNKEQDNAEVGLWLGSLTGGVVVLAVLPGTPAEKGGFRPGDKILKIAGKAVGTAWDASKLLDGEAGSGVEILFERPNGSVKKIKLTREEVPAPSVIRHELTHDGIGYIQIGRFVTNLPTEVLSIVREFIEKNFRGLVLDIRGSPGGMLAPSTSLAEFFLKAE